ncbi:MAG: hypothetical protein E3J78_03380, partial [Candidatus Cloacimonadota bacterium]
MIKILKKTNFDFIGARKKSFILSLVLIAVGIISLFIRGGLNYGIDFSGGTLIQLHFEKPISTSEIREALIKIGYSKAQIQKFGTANDFLLRTASGESFITDTIGPSILEARTETEKGKIRNIIIKATVS